MELMTGCKNAKQLRDIKRTISLFTVLPISELISLRAQAFMEAYTLSHGLLIPDALVAATAFESGIALYTRNVRHYKMIPNLLIIQPY